MRKPDLFDEIILLMKQQMEQYPTTEVSPELLEKLFSDAAPQKPQTFARPAAPQPAQQVQRPVYNTPPPMPAQAYAFTPAPPAPKPKTVVSSFVDCSGMDLDALRDCTMKCNRCGLCSTRTNVVFGDGNPHAELMFIGEGPGQDEDEQGLPFVGRSGELLTRMIAAMGFDRHRDVYIANIVKCRPPGNRNPDDMEAKTCIPYLERQIELIHPKVIVLLGAVPLLHLLNMRGILKLHGQWFDYKGIKVLPTFHPAFLLRDSRKKADAWADLQVVMKEFGHVPPPPRKK